MKDISKKKIPETLDFMVLDLFGMLVYNTNMYLKTNLEFLHQTLTIVLIIN